MGKLVTFWSPYIGQAKVTSSLCAIVAMFGIQHPELSVAVSHVNQDSMELEEKLDQRNDMRVKWELYQKTGVAALKLNYQQAIPTSEKIRRSAIPLKMKSLYLYPFTEQKMDLLTVRLLTETLKNEFDVVFLDLESGQRENSRCLMKKADLVVIVLPQSPVYWASFVQQDMSFLDGKQVCVLLGGCLENSKYGRKYYSRKKYVKEGMELVGTIPMNAGFLDAMSEGRTLDYFLRNQLVRRKEENYEFIVQTKEAAEHIRKKIFLS